MSESFSFERGDHEMVNEVAADDQQFRKVS
jgi:hypothetical protein